MYTYSQYHIQTEWHLICTLIVSTTFHQSGISHVHLQLVPHSNRVASHLYTYSQYHIPTEWHLICTLIVSTTFQQSGISYVHLQLVPPSNRVASHMYTYSQYHIPSFWFQDAKSILRPLFLSLFKNTRLMVQMRVYVCTFIIVLSSECIGIQKLQKLYGSINVLSGEGKVCERADVGVALVK